MQEQLDESEVEPAEHSVLVASALQAAQGEQVLPSPQNPALQLHEDVSLVELYGHSTRVASEAHAAQVEQVLPVP